MNKDLEQQLNQLTKTMQRIAAANRKTQKAMSNDKGSVAAEHPGFIYDGENK